MFLGPLQLLSLKMVKLVDLFLSFILVIQFKVYFSDMTSLWATLKRKSVYLTRLMASLAHWANYVIIISSFLSGINDCQLLNRLPVLISSVITDGGTT